MKDVERADYIFKLCSNWSTSHNNYIGLKIFIWDVSVMNDNSFWKKTMLFKITIFVALIHWQPVTPNLIYAGCGCIRMQLHTQLQCTAPITFTQNTIISFLFSILFYFTDIKFYIYLCTFLCVYILQLLSCFGCSQYILLLSIIPSPFYDNHNNLVILYFIIPSLNSAKVVKCLILFRN